MPLQVRAVLFAKDAAALATFYHETLGLTPSTWQADHVVLSSLGFDLVVHQIPERLAQAVTLDAPPRRREQAAMKLCFPVENIERARAAAAALGGVLDPPASEWMDGDAATCLGHDPEGNVFQVRARARAGSY